MLKNTAKILLGLLLLGWLVYLLLPPPQELPPLPGSLKSIEPGDTTQILGISAYYTNLSRAEVLAFYQESFSKSSFLQIPLVTYRLNHPPEYARKTIRGTLQSSYYEEVVHPFRESLYVNGYEWANDPFTPPEHREKNKPVINGKEFSSKVTIIARYSTPFRRIAIMVLSILSIAWLMGEFKGIYKSRPRKG